LPSLACSAIVPEKVMLGAVVSWLISTSQDLVPTSPAASVDSTVTRCCPVA
jgi:hypothetical protein